MKITNQHTRVFAATPEQIAGLVADLDRIWPTDIAPAPRSRGAQLLEAGAMLWEEVDRAGAVRAFRVVSPPELQAEHWFELEPSVGGTLLRHTVAGDALGEYETIWRERISPLHDRVLEALLDNLDAAIQTA
jgi:hypothetical protein